ncbi:MAG: hypothetical protein FJ086_09720, partial [Deltaproteobacteria bacterium]|nr:hypothetical protein [Deltaproteobacteria bacterium]
MKALAKVLLSSLLLVGASASAQGYVLTPSSEPYTSVIPLGATPVTLVQTGIFGALDEGAAVVPIGFDFSLAGKTYTHVNVNSNGFIELLEDANTTPQCGSSCYGSGIPSTEASAFVAPWWGDLEGTTSGGILTLAGAGVFDVEYALWGYYGSSSTATFNFRVTFRDTGTGTSDDTIELRYGAFTGTSSATTAAGVQWTPSGAATPLPCGANRTCKATNWTDPADGLTDTLFVLEKDSSPDLSVPQVTLTAFGTAPGADGGVYNATFDVEALIKNSGLSEAPNVHWQAWLSKDKSCCSSDIKLYDSYFDGGTLASPVDVPELGEVGVTTSVTAQDLSKSQEYFVLVKADSRNAISEPLETDNTGRTTAGFIFGTDLVADDVRVKPGTVVANNQVTLQVSAQNRGTNAAGTVDYELRLATSKTASTSTLVHQGTLTLGAVQSVVSQEVAVSMPPNLANGSYYWSLVLDPGNAITEVSETNNRVFSASTSVIGLDLVATAVAQAPALTVAGATVNLSVSARNNGSDSAASVPYAVVLSVDKVLDSGDTVIHQGQLSFAAYEVKTLVPVSFTLPT